MSECCGVARSGEGLLEGVARLDEDTERTWAMEVRPELAGYDDLAHAFDLQGSLLAARATLECALELRESRGAHSRLDYPDQDPRLRFEPRLVTATQASLVNGPPSPQPRSRHSPAAPELENERAPAERARPAVRPGAEATLVVVGRS